MSPFYGKQFSCIYELLPYLKAIFLEFLIPEIWLLKKYVENSLVTQTLSLKNSFVGEKRVLTILK